MLPIFIINIETDNLRKEHIKKELSNINIDNYTFIKGIEESGFNNHDFQINKYWKNIINCGEIGCFLSHYKIWNQMYKENIEAAIILEDDTYFVDNFTSRIKCVFDIPSNMYDFCYLSRIQRFPDIKEIHIDDNLLIPNYSYNMNAYILTHSGATKLINTDCINNIMPVDEFLPIMYDEKYPYKTYRDIFKNDPKLNALAFINDIANQIPRTKFPSNIIHSKLYINR